MAGLERLHPHLQHAIIHDLGWRSLRAVQELTIDAILDFAGERTGHFRMIECEVGTHDEYGAPRELFVAFFGVIMRTLQEVLGPDFTAEMDEAWRKLIGWSTILLMVASQSRPWRS